MCRKSAARPGTTIAAAAAVRKLCPGRAQVQVQVLVRVTATAMPNGILCPAMAEFCTVTAATAASESCASVIATAKGLAFRSDLSFIAKTK